MSTSTCDAILVVPPISPSDTNPPLGPYVLKAAAEKLGLRIDVVDLSIRYNRRYGTPIVGLGSRLDTTVGDQDKDRRLTHAARECYRQSSPLAREVPLCRPAHADPLMGMHYSFDSIERGVERACADGSSHREFLDREFFGRQGAPPRVLAISVMGPPQVLFALVLARLARRRWPSVPIVAGGSHVTLLKDEIERDSRYGADIDVFMAGHCENQFARLLANVRESGTLPPYAGITAGKPSEVTRDEMVRPTIRGKRQGNAGFDYRPAFDRPALADYDPARLTLPMQLTRGCSYGKCSYCTYTAVEPAVDVTPDWPRAMVAIRDCVAETGVRRISFKDSLFTLPNLRALARQLLDGGPQIEWSATTLLTRDLATSAGDLHRSGLRTLEFGLESIDPIGQRLFEKPLELEMVRSVVRAATDAGIIVVLNQIVGWPGQTEESALTQLKWYDELQKERPGLVRASWNQLEINRASRMAASPTAYGIELRGVAPWAFSYDWDSPRWAPRFLKMLDQQQAAQGAVSQRATRRRSGGCPG